MLEVTWLWGQKQLQAPFLVMLYRLRLTELLSFNEAYSKLVGVHPGGDPTVTCRSAWVVPVWSLESYLVASLLVV